MMLAAESEQLTVAECSAGAGAGCVCIERESIIKKVLKCGSICTNSHLTWYYQSSTVYGMILYIDVLVVRSGLDPVMVIKLK